MTRSACTRILTFRIKMSRRELWIVEKPILTFHIMVDLCCTFFSDMVPKCTANEEFLPLDEVVKISQSCLVFAGVPIVQT